MIEHFSEFPPIFKNTEIKSREQIIEELIPYVKQEVKKGTIIHIPPCVIHGADGKMRVLVIGIPDIDDSDIYYP